jgi:hypothetical protein
MVPLGVCGRGAGTGSRAGAAGAAGALGGGRTDAEDAGLEALALDEVDLERTAGLVALGVGVLLGRGDEVVGEVVLVVTEALVVGGAELDRVEVGHHRAPVTDDRGAVVHGAPDGRGDLDGLDLRLERLREGTVDSLGQTVLDTVDESHAVSSFVMRACRWALHRNRVTRARPQPTGGG